LKFSRFLGLGLLLLLPLFVCAGVTEHSLVYSVRIAFLDTGDFHFKRSSSQSTYFFSGHFETKGLINKYYRWKGEFAAIGSLENGSPKMEKYYARSESKDHELKLVVLEAEGVRFLPPGGKTFQFSDRPKGDDLVTALFLTPRCYDGPHVNDGEDTFEMFLTKVKEIKQKKEKFGPILKCYYRVKDYKGRSRRLNVTISSSAYGPITKEVRVKIPLLPDVVFDLKKHEQIDTSS
tara:strand:+ start:110 stop:811 length:702 start_codon:yes stop_codon:yes gene_type:complete